MNRSDFITAVIKAFPVGTVIANPGGGTSTITGYTVSSVSYVRGRSTIVVAFSDLYAAYNAFKGKDVTSTELRAFMPTVFDSAARPTGHSCNCTFLYQAI